MFHEATTHAVMPWQGDQPRCATACIPSVPIVPRDCHLLMRLTNDVAVACRRTLIYRYCPGFMSFHGQHSIVTLPACENQHNTLS
eukprot:COSAG02_NODE_567_length_20212_cov_18.927460_15_plen_85_part_00